VGHLQLVFSFSFLYRVAGLEDAPYYFIIAGAKKIYPFRGKEFHHNHLLSFGPKMTL